MKIPASQSGLIYPRALVAFVLCSLGIFLAMFSFAATPPGGTPANMPPAQATAGSWQIVPSPNADTSRQNELNGVTCASATDCWAVGDYYTANNAYQTLIEHWDGNSWAIVSSPNTDPTQTNLLFNVTCVSTSNCWAVGKHKQIVGAAPGQAIIIIDQTLIEHWDGSSWTIVTSPSSQPIEAYLEDVTCTASTDCWAVGYAANVVTGLYETQIEHWDGNLWTLSTSPNTSVHNYLQSVTCTSVADCWAVGFTLDPSTNITQNLAEHWDGSIWTIVAAPNTSSTRRNNLLGVTCTSASDCWAAGYFDPGPGFAYATLLEHWDGTAWAIVSSPNAGNRNNFLFNVTCAAASNCWAVGRYYNSIADQTLTEHWDGTAWTIIGSPNTSDRQYNDPSNVTCASTTDCWAVGNYITGSNIRQTLALHYTTPPPIPTSVVSRKTHGSAGDFDVDLPLSGNPGIECRSGPISGDHQVIVTFANAVTVTDATVTPGLGETASLSLVPGPGPNQFTINLSNVSNGQTLTLNLLGVSDGPTTGDVHIAMGVLFGDVNGNGVVSNTDVSSLKAQVAAPVDSSNFRNDVNANGVISNIDVSAVKAQVGTSLP